MNEKTSALIVYLATIVKKVINMEINCVQVVIFVHLKQEPPMLTPALLGVTLKNKEHKVGSSTRFCRLLVRTLRTVKPYSPLFCMVT